MARFGGAPWMLGQKWAAHGTARLRDCLVDPRFFLAPSRSTLEARSVEGQVQMAGRHRSCDRGLMAPLDVAQRFHEGAH